MGFEPTCPVKDNCISSAARYDRFDNSPCHICNISLKKTSGKRRELMERTKVISVVNNTAKAPKNQGFLEKWFQSGHSFSSAPRYDRFDTTPDCSRGSLQPLFYSKTSRRILQDFPAFFPRAFSKSRTKAFSKALSRPFPMRFTAFCPPAFCGNSAEILREVQP